MTKPKTVDRRLWEDSAEFSLDSRGRREIVEALGLTNIRPSEVIAQVEVDLMIATHWRNTKVRPAGRLKLLESVIAAANSFERALLELDHKSWDVLVENVDRRVVDLPFAFQRYIAKELAAGSAKRRGFMLKYLEMPPPTIPVAITEIAQAARAQREQLRRVQTRGKPREDARDNAIRKLADTFHKAAHGREHYRGRLIDFVKAALRAAKLPVPTSEEKVWALVPPEFRKSRKGPSNWPRTPTLDEVLAAEKT